MSFLIAASFSKTELFINEIDQKWLRLILFNLRAMPKFDRNGSRISVIEGSKKSCGLEGRNLDRIIVRDAFHHFKKQKAMLESIRKSLAPSGLALVLEPTIEDTKPLFCKKTMRRAAIETAWAEAGFELLEAQKIGGGKYILFKFGLR